MHSPTRHRVAVLLALAGVAATAYAAWIGSQISADGAYRSACEIGGTISCDAVIGSRFSQLFGVPVSWVGAVAFVLGALLALPGALGNPIPLADAANVALASGSLGFALAMARVMLTVLNKVCLVCSAIDVLTIAWWVAVVPLGWRLEGRLGVVTRVATVVGIVVALAGGTLATIHGPGPARTLAEVKAEDEKFYDLYVKLPVRPAAEVEGVGRPLKGTPDAPVTIVEFSDFECPACGGAFADLKAFVSGRRDIRMVFRHFPLDKACNPAVQHSMHPDACLAAYAAECAGEQDRFWQYHDQLFEHQKVLDRDSLFRYAREVGLDIPAFRTCLDAPETRARVVADIEVGLKLGVASTPTLFFNGRIVDGALEPPYYDYALIIEKHLMTGRADGG